MILSARSVVSLLMEAIERHVVTNNISSPEKLEKFLADLGLDASVNVQKREEGFVMFSVYIEGAEVSVEFRRISENILYSRAKPEDEGKLSEILEGKEDLRIRLESLLG